MPGPALRLLLVLVAAAPTVKPGPAEPEPAAAAGQVKENQTQSMMTKTTSPGRLQLKSSVQTGLQKDHLPYKCLWEKEEFVVLKNGREFNLKSEMRANTYKKKKLLFRNMVLKLALFRGKQINYGIRKENVSPVLTKTKVSILVRKPRHLEKQKNMKAKLQKGLKNTPSRRTRLTAETPLQFVIAELNWLDRKWRWLKGEFLKASIHLNTLRSTPRNKQGIRGTVENNSKLQKKNGPSSRPLKPTRIVWQGKTTWKLYNLRMVYKELCQSMSSERVPSMKDEEEPEKDEIIPKALQGNLGSLNSSANGGSTWKVQSRIIFFGCYTKKCRKGLPVLLTSIKAKSVTIQIREFENRVILSVTKCVPIGNDGSRDPFGRQTSTELRDIIHILARNEGQEIKSLTSNFIQEKLKLFKVTSKDKEHRVKIWSVYVRMSFRLHQRNANTFQRKINRLVNRDGSQTDPRAPNRKPEVGPGAPELEGDRKASQQIRLEEGGEKNSWNKTPPPSTTLIHSQLYTFILRTCFNNTVMLREKLIAFLEAFVAHLPRKSQPGFAVISPKSSSFELESQQVNSVRNLGKIRRLILNLWKTKHTISRVLPGNIKLRSKKPIQPNNHDMSVTSRDQKLLQDSESLSSLFLFAPSSELIKRQKRDAAKNGEMVQVPVDFLNHLSSLLGVGVGVVAVAFIILSIVISILYFKRRELFQVSKVAVIKRKYPDESYRAIRASCFHGVSLSRSFHSKRLKVLRDKESESQEALQNQKQNELGLMMRSIMSSDSSSNGESMNLDQNSLSSSSSSSVGSFFIQSLDASRDWYSDEEGSFCSSSLKGSFIDRVQVYLETMNSVKNFKEFQCGMTISEDENGPTLGKTNQQKTQVPKSASNPSGAFCSSPYPPESVDNPSKPYSASL